MSTAEDPGRSMQGDADSGGDAGVKRSCADTEGDLPQELKQGVIDVFLACGQSLAAVLFEWQSLEGLVDMCGASPWAFTKAAASFSRTMWNDLLE